MVGWTRRARESEERAAQTRRYWAWVRTLPKKERDAIYAQAEVESDIFDKRFRRAIVMFFSVSSIVLLACIVYERRHPHHGRSPSAEASSSRQHILLP